MVEIFDPVKPKKEMQLLSAEQINEILQKGETNNADSIANIIKKVEYNHELKLPSPMCVHVIHAAVFEYSKWRFYKIKYRIDY